MRYPRIYQQGSYNVGDLFELQEAQASHVGQALRMKEGEKLILFSGDNLEYEAIIKASVKRKIQIQLLSAKEVNRESSKNIHLIQALSKGDRMETVVQKAVELGVASITPVVTEFCALRLEKDRIEKKWRQWQAIAISACEQCGRNLIPFIHEPISLIHYLSSKSSNQHFVLDPRADKTWRDYDFHDEKISLLVGPEGGLSSQEFEQLKHENFSPMSLGPRVLRTETAAIAAITLIQVLAGDL